jgi:hypothetical protein
MGHPVNNKYFGYDVQHHNNAYYPAMPFRNNAVLTPYVRFEGSSHDAVILRQLSSNKFLVARVDDPSVQIEMTLTNNDLSQTGHGRLYWYTFGASSNGWVAHLYDNTIHTFTGQSLQWNITGGDSLGFNHALAYISANSRD